MTTVWIFMLYIAQEEFDMGKDLLSRMYLHISFLPGAAYDTHLVWSRCHLPPKAQFLVCNLHQDCMQ